MGLALFQAVLTLVAGTVGVVAIYLFKHLEEMDDYEQKK
tara:strand:- start:2147 stop:2263 length:117 start_codon:yes stop_codon:yes gene_type:complete